jgi:hypothetical protein
LGVRWGQSWENISIQFVLEKIFSKTSRLISIKLDAKCPCMKRFQIHLDKETNPHQTNDSEKLRFT